MEVVWEDLFKSSHLWEESFWWKLKETFSLYHFSSPIKKLGSTPQKKTFEILLSCPFSSLLFKTLEDSSCGELNGCCCKMTEPGIYYSIYWMLLTFLGTYTYAVMYRGKLCGLSSVMWLLLQTLLVLTPAPSAEPFHTLMVNSLLIFLELLPRTLMLRSLPAKRRPGSELFNNSGVEFLNEHPAVIYTWCEVEYLKQIMPA